MEMNSTNRFAMRADETAVLKPPQSRRSAPWPGTSKFRGATPANPKGIVSSSPGLRGTSYPGFSAKNDFNPNGVASLLHRPAATPLGLGAAGEISQGSSCLATLGFEPESPWDSAAESVGFLRMDL